MDGGSCCGGFSVPGVSGEADMSAAAAASGAPAACGTPAASGAHPPRIGIMGGTFDPIHIGHLDCARVAQRDLGLGRVLFMPAASTNFKQGRISASSDDRVAMCALAIADKPLWKICPMEVERGGTTYTVDTLRELRGHCPDAQLYFITGSDSLRTIDTWHGADELRTLAHFVAVERPGYRLDPQRREELVRAGFRIHCVVNDGFDISSTELRRRIAEGKGIRGLVPARVEAYIRTRGLYGAHDAGGNVG